MTLKAVVAVVVLCVAGIVAQEGTPQIKPFMPTSDSLKMRYESSRAHLIELADRMPAADYTFRPTPQMEPFAERIAHVADLNFEQCAWLVSKPNPYKGVKLEAKFTQKAELMTLLRESFAYCDGYFSRLSPDVMAEKISTEAPPGASFRVVQVELGGVALPVITHNAEMYGYLAVYLRLKGIVPPTSGRARLP